MPPISTQVRLPLSERYRPSRLDDLIGNHRAVEALRRWGQAWMPGAEPPRQRAALLEGPPGLGKTTAAFALAREFGWSVVEMNASDARNRSAIEAVAGRASLSVGFAEDGSVRSARAGGRTLILLDEADCLTGRATEAADRKAPKRPFREFLRTRYGSVAALNEAWGLGEPKRPTPFESWETVPLTGGRGAWTKLEAARRDLADWEESAAPRDLSDRGGLGAIAALVRSTLQPVVLTVNDPSSLSRYSPIFRTAVLRVSFSGVAPTELRRRLEQIADQEQLALAPGAIDAIVARSRGDVRAALTDLEAIAPLPAGPAQLAVLGGRDLSSEIAEFVGEALSRPQWRRSVEIRDRIDAPPDDLLPWVEENAPYAATDPRRRLEALETIARAERLLAFARRRRHFGLWSYASELLTGGVSIALDRPAGAFPVRARFPQFLGEMGRMRAARATRATLLGKVGHAVHLSRRLANSAQLALLYAAFDLEGDAFGTAAHTELRRRTILDWDLSVEEVAYLLSRPVDGSEVQDAWTLAHPPEPEPSVPAVAAPGLLATDLPEPGSRGKRAKASGTKKRVQKQLG
ncbi:MAG TPA: AAA family ATPase [Thermoplasmata archaeon]|nr:AAA family ATPase [Thermoplasmata archaeon]